MAVVRFEHVVKNYGQVHAVKDLNLVGELGEFLCLLGPSGCGKSSTLRMVAGLEFISEGSIYFDDHRINELEPRERDIAMVFEAYALYPHMTVRQNIENPLRLRKYPKAEVASRVKMAAELLEIGELLDRKPAQLSGGQKQRVAIGRAIVREPKVFLFDEPISHLDAKLRAHMRGEIKRLQKELGTSMIYVTHDQTEALTMADKIAVMNQGVLQQVGTPEDIYQSPANEWVATFVGEPSMNIFPVEIVAENGALFAVNSDLTVRLAEKHRVALEEMAKAGGKRAAKLGIRAPDLGFGDRNDPNAVEARVYVTEPLGEETVIRLRLKSDAALTMRAKGIVKAALDETMFVTMDSSKLHLFDAETGVAIAATKIA
jgi:multiple sugar transport system ATP-binding protein